MADLRWNLKYNGNEYEFNAQRDLTVRYLRQAKQWFGAEYGRWAFFIQALAQGDADAWSCALWIARKNAGEKNLPEPQFMDFEVGSLMTDSEVVQDDPEQGADPTAVEDTGGDGEASGSPAQTPASTPTPTSSETATSST